MSCLSEDDVVEFVSGRLSRDEYTSVEQHLTECRVCLALVARTASAVLRPERAVAEQTVRESATRAVVTMDAPAPPPVVSQPGLVVAGKYRLDHLIGQGGMGAVWAAVELEGGREVAVKFLRGLGSARADSRKRFLREARAAAAVSHAHVVEIIELVELSDGAPAIVMDLLVGESLRQRLSREKTLALSHLAGLLVPVVSAIGTAHAAGIVHRDLKPDNLFLTLGPDGICPKVLDFGVAKLTATEGDAAQTEGLTQTGDMLGTPYYMAPEQAFGEHDIDHRADIWALGVILYECLAGERPFRGDNLGQLLKRITTGSYPPLGPIRPELPSEIVELVTRMLQRERAARPIDLHEVQDVLARHTGVRAPEFGPALASASGELAAQTPPAPSAPSVTEPVPRRRARAPLWLAVIASLGLAIGMAVWRVLDSMSKPVAPAVVAAPPPPVAAPPPPVAAPAPVPVAAPPVAAPAPAPKRKTTRAPAPAPAPAPPTEPARRRGDVVKEVPF